jgi:hypothetical protein
LTPKITLLNIPEIINAAKHLCLKGTTRISQDNLFYLDIDDEYIHQLFPLLNDNQVKKPDYFGEKSAGAHITIIYPEEGKIIYKEKDLAKEHHFLIKNMAIAEIGHKTYYVLLVDSSSLLQLRRQFQLPDLLCFKDYFIGFHITIGVKIFSSNNL